MRLTCLLFTAILAATPAAAQTTAAAVGQTPAALDLPVSLDRIRKALEQTSLLSLRTVDERPTFRVQIMEKQKIEELLATLNYKAGPTPAGGVYWDEIQKQMFPATDNPLRQPYAAFSQSELLTILAENLAGRYLGGKAASMVGKAERTHAETAAKEEVRQAVRAYCAAQPDGGSGITICALSPSVR